MERAPLSHLRPSSVHRGAHSRALRPRRGSRGEGEPGPPEAARAPLDGRRDREAKDRAQASLGDRPRAGEEAPVPRLSHGLGRGDRRSPAGPEGSHRQPRRAAAGRRASRGGQERGGHPDPARPPEDESPPDRRLGDPLRRAGASGADGRGSRGAEEDGPALSAGAHELPRGRREPGAPGRPDRGSPEARGGGVGDGRRPRRAGIVLARIAMLEGKFAEALEKGGTPASRIAGAARRLLRASTSRGPRSSGARTSSTSRKRSTGRSWSSSRRASRRSPGSRSSRPRAGR